MQRQGAAGAIPPPGLSRADDHQDYAWPERQASDDAETDRIWIGVFGQAQRSHENDRQQRPAAQDEQDHADPEHP